MDKPLGHAGKGIVTVGPGALAGGEDYQAQSGLAPEDPDQSLTRDGISFSFPLFEEEDALAAPWIELSMSDEVEDVERLPECLAELLQAGVLQ